MEWCDRLGLISAEKCRSEKRDTCRRHHWCAMVGGAPHLNRLLSENEIAGESEATALEHGHHLGRGPALRIGRKLQAVVGDERSPEIAARAHVPEHPRKFALDDVRTWAEQRKSRCPEFESTFTPDPIPDVADRPVAADLVDRNAHARSDARSGNLRRRQNHATAGASASRAASRLAETNTAPLRTRGCRRSSASSHAEPARSR